MKPAENPSPDSKPVICRVCSAIESCPMRFVSVSCVADSLTTDGKRGTLEGPSACEPIHPISTTFVSVEWSANSCVASEKSRTKDPLMTDAQSGGSASPSRSAKSVEAAQLAVGVDWLDVE